MIGANGPCNVTGNALAFAFFNRPLPLRCSDLLAVGI